MLARITAWVVAGTINLACVATPQPDPPNASLDPDRILSQGPEIDGPILLMSGEEGAIDPPGAVLRVWSLDREDPPVDSVSDETGAFAAEVPGESGEGFRLQVLADRERSTPVDVIAFGGEEPEYVIPDGRDLGGCLRTEPELEATVTVVDGGSVLVFNDCEGPLTLSRISMRAPGSPFGVTAPAVPFDLAPRDRIVVEVEQAAPADDPAEEILLIEASAPEPERQPITLIGEAL